MGESRQMGVAVRGVEAAMDCKEPDIVPTENIHTKSKIGEKWS